MDLRSRMGPPPMHASLKMEDGKPAVLFAAVKPEKDEDDSYNIHIPIS